MFAFCQNASTSEVLVLPKEEHQKPLPEDYQKYTDIDKYKPLGPLLPDGSINWQCSCMAGGSLIAHRCGHYFRKLYVCMKSEGEDKAEIKCPDQFVDWAACMQNMSKERRELMRRAMTEDVKIEVKKQ